VAQPLEILSVDVLSGRQFVVYFNDDTVVRMSATELAECFPERSKVQELEDAAASEDAG
jgi:hypothetical protein